MSRRLNLRVGVAISSASSSGPPNARRGSEHVRAVSRRAELSPSANRWVTRKCIGSVVTFPGPA
jgi:hypothetical protein